MIMHPNTPVTDIAPTSRSGVGRTRILHRIGASVAAVIVAAGGLVVSAGPANAVGTYVHRVCGSVVDANRIGQRADFCVGFDYSGRMVGQGNRLHAYAKVVVRRDGQQILAPVTISTLHLGDGNGVIDTVSNKGSNTGAVEVDTPRMDYTCHLQTGANYNAHAWFEVRFPGGLTAKWGFYTLFWQSNGSDGACTNSFKTYYDLDFPPPPSYVVADFG